MCPLGDTYSLSVRVNCQQQTLMQATPCGLITSGEGVGTCHCIVSVLY